MSGSFAVWQDTEASVSLFSVFFVGVIVQVSVKGRTAFNHTVGNGNRNPPTGHICCDNLGMIQPLSMASTSPEVHLNGSGSSKVPNLYIGRCCTLLIAIFSRSQVRFCAYIFSRRTRRVPPGRSMISRRFSTWSLSTQKKYTTTESTTDSTTDTRLDFSTSILSR